MNDDELGPFWEPSGELIESFELSARFDCWLDEVYGTIVVAHVEIPASVALHDVDRPLHREYQTAMRVWLTTEVAEGRLLTEEPE